MPETTLVTNTGTTTVTEIPFATPVVLTPVGAAGLTPGGVFSATSSQSTPAGKLYNYTLIVQIPIPFFNLGLDLNLIGNFVLPALAVLGVPQAVAYFSANAIRIIQNVVDTAVKLIKAIPEATVTILVKIGSVTILNVVLVAEKTPVVIPAPHFQLDLPDFAIDANFNFSVDFPVPPPIQIAVPIPVPIIAWPPSLVTVSGGQIVAVASGAIQAAPEPIHDPIYFPQI